MGHSPRLPSEQREDIVRRYTIDHVSGNALAKEFGVPPMVVYRALYAAGVMRQRKPFGDMRRCGSCKVEQPLSEFAKCATRPEWNYRAYECKRCVRTKHFTLGYSLKGNTGLTLDQYKTLLDQQNGHCALCDTVPNHARLHVDHDHATGEIRGLLCSRCNRSMAAIDDAVWHDKAVHYAATARTGLTFKGKKS